MLKKIIINVIVLAVAYHTSALADQSDDKGPLSRESNKLIELHAPKTDSIYMSPMGTPDKGSFNTYYHDGCNKVASNIQNEQELREIGLRRCEDGTVSYVQPDAEGFQGYEGKCGQTAAANLMYSYCKIIVKPETYANSYLSDYSPGVRPDTMRYGMNNMFKSNYPNCPSAYSKKWHYYSYDTSKEYINAIERGLSAPVGNSHKIKRTRADGTKIFRTPVALLIRSPGGQILHWITAVDVVRINNKCEILVNHWDDQYKVPCHIISKWSRGVGNSYGDILDSYTIIKFK